MKYFPRRISWIPWNSAWLWLLALRHILCPWLQFGGWYQNLQGQKEEVISEEPEESKESVVREPAYKVETKVLHYIKVLGNDNSSLRPKQISHTLVDEIAVHFWKTGLRLGAMLEHSKYKTAVCIY